MSKPYPETTYEERIAFVLAAWKDRSCGPPADQTPESAVNFGHTSIADYAMRKIWEAKHGKAK